MVDLTRGERLQIMLTGKELEAVDNWRFQARMPSRAAAVRELLKRGLAAEGFTLADGGAKSRRISAWWRMRKLRNPVAVEPPSCNKKAGRPL